MEQPLGAELEEIVEALGGAGEDEDDGRVARYEPHRAFVRKMHHQMERVYTYGGLIALALPGVLLCSSWALGILAKPAVWLGSVTLALLGLYVARQRARRAQPRLEAQIVDYCQVNEVDVSGLRAYYAHDGTYRFFEVIFDRAASE